MQWHYNRDIPYETRVLVQTSKENLYAVTRYPEAPGELAIVENSEVDEQHLVITRMTIQVACVRCWSPISIMP